MSEARIAALETKLAALEKKIEDKKFAVGARGPAGDITAAVSNAEQVAKGIVAGVKASTFDHAVERLNAAEAKVKSTIEEKCAALEDEVAAIVLKILHEYHVIDEKNVPYTYGK